MLALRMGPTSTRIKFSQISSRGGVFLLAVRCLGDGPPWSSYCLARDLASESNRGPHRSYETLTKLPSFSLLPISTLSPSLHLPIFSSSSPSPCWFSHQE